METLENAVQLLQNSQEQGLVVVENDQAKGVLTRKQLLKGLSDYGKTAPVSKVIQKDPIMIAPDMPLQEVYQKLAANNFSLAPVLEDGKLLGIVDIKRINEFIIARKELEKHP